MKNSIAKKLTVRAALMLLAAVLIIFIGTYHSVSRAVREENEQYSKAILSVYTDLLITRSDDANVPLDTEHPDIAVLIGDYICSWYAVDYAYIYVPRSDGTIMYISAAKNEKNPDINMDDHFIGHISDRKMSNEELAVWNGEKLFGFTVMDNSYGREYSTLMKIEDGFGNKMMAGVDISLGDMESETVSAFIGLALLIFAVFAIIVAFMYIFIIRRVSRPAKLISDRMNDFISDKGHNTEKLCVNGDDEFSMIASAFNSMTDDMDEYIRKISRMNREKEYEQNELAIAAAIQKGFLPDEYACGAGYEIHTLMVPAKDVGGDLYDWLPLGNGRTLIVTADVSGKGIAAALFMTVILTLIRQFAKINMEPCEILKRTNDALTQRNPTMLFVTAFVGIYDCNDKTLTYSNAGHCVPYILKERPTALDGACGTLIGLFEDEEYTQEKVQLDVGDILLLYTDGVSEAIDPEKHFYGTERLERALCGFKASKENDPVAYVYSSVCEFANGAERQDDITMLSLKVTDGADILLDAETSEFEKIKNVIMKSSAPYDTKIKLCVVSEEIFTNICLYAFKGVEKKNEKVRFSAEYSPDSVTVRFEDGGMKYDPTADVIDIEDYDMDSSVGGLGKYMAFSIADEAHYEYLDGKNVLTLKKYIISSDEMRKDGNKNEDKQNM